MSHVFQVLKWFWGGVYEVETHIFLCKVDLFLV